MISSAVAAVLLFAASTVSQQNLVLSPPNGEYDVAHSTAQLVDLSRIDQLDPNKGKRNVMISLFYPTERSACAKTCNIDYMPLQTASYVDRYAVQNYGVPNNTMTNIKMPVCCETKKDSSRHNGKFPVVLFQPGLTNSRLQYNYHAATLASSGYAVVTMDHAFESLIVEYPGGRVALGVEEEYWDPYTYPERFEDQIDTRVADARFVLQQLERGNVLKELGVPGGLDTRRAALYGHSFGGAAAIASSTRKGDPFKGAINMDGQQFGVNSTTTKPVLLFGRVDRTVGGDNTWEEDWGFYKGWKKEISLSDSKHNTFGGDLALIFKLRGVPRNEKVDKATGKLDGQRSFEVVGAYVRAFMDFVLKGKEMGLLDGPSQSYPEISFL